MIKKVKFNLDLRDVINKSNRNGNIIEPRDVINDELLNRLVDEIITNHIRDFLSTYIKKELGLDSLEFEGD